MQKATLTENTSKPSKKALLIIDTQSEILYNKDDDEYHFNYKSFLRNVVALLEQAHASDTAIIYIQHDDGDGHSLKADRG
jgi:nicotinamidase-related amidase